MSSICNASISDQSWLQATLPCLLGGLRLREASRASSAALLGCCVSSFALCSQLWFSFSGYSITLSSIPGEELANTPLSASLSGTPVPEVPASQVSEAQWIFQSQLDACQSNSLLSSCSLCVQARIRAISSHSCASAWLRAIPSGSLGLTMSRQEFVCSLWYWLGISIFSSTDSVRCSCGSAVDQFGDHLLGCGHGPMRIRQHDALCDVIFHALPQDNSGCKREQHCGTNLDRPGDVLYPDYLYGKPTLMLLCVIPCRILFLISLLCWLVLLHCGVRWRRMLIMKRQCLVLGTFHPFGCGDSGPLSPASLKVLRDIAIRTTNRSGAGIALACCHFLEQLSMCLWRHNSRMFLHHFSLLPVGPLWELSPEVDSPAHGTSHSEP